MELVITGATSVEPGSPAELADAFRDAERRMETEMPEIVRLEDASDQALAAALVAAKLLVPVSASHAASDPATANGRLIALIAGT